MKEMSDDEHYAWEADQERFLDNQVRIIDSGGIKSLDVLSSKIQSAGTDEATFSGRELVFLGICVLHVQIRVRLRELRRTRRAAKEGRNGDDA